MEKFLLELLGTTDIPTYLAWFVLSVIGAVTATLIRNHLTNLKSFPVNSVQLLTGFLITFISIRFSNDLLGLEPNAWGALLIGATNNEIALAFVKKFLVKQQQAQMLVTDPPPPEDIGGGGIKNPKP